MSFGLIEQAIGDEARAVEAIIYTKCETMLTELPFELITNENSLASKQPQWN